MLNAIKQNLLTGNEEIDSLQSEVITKINNLLLSSKAGRGHEELGQFFWFLKRYTRKHFVMEERYQRESGFPGYEEHKAQHESFILEVRQLESRYAREGLNTVLFVAVIRLMGDWLRNHINQMDIIAARFLRRVSPN